ncbi:helix-turn-helix domain-containing protein [Priestia megaterium]|uniref:helix-turn-helix domain-containing protein n=1 Tax=Priestia megaterium TaxID=1404 RepID=UPI003AB2E59B
MKYIKCIKQKYSFKIDGTKIKIARAEKGWTITKLAVESGITRKTIGEIEKGKKKSSKCYY